MRINKYSIYFTSGITIIALIAAIVFNCYNFTFCANLFSGIFASGLLALILTVIGYFVERKRTLEKFYSYAQKAVKNFNSYENDGDLERTIDTILQMDSFDYIELGNAYTDISFLFNNKDKRDYIYYSIYNVITELGNLIRKKASRFKEY